MFILEYKQKLNLIYGAKTGKSREEEDFYATSPEAIYLAKDMFTEIGLSKKVWECACGKGHISEALRELGYNVKSSDKIDRGYGKVIDFLKYTKKQDCDIVTNPPFKLWEEFAYKGLEILTKGNFLCLFAKIQILETKSRRVLFKKFPPKFIYVYSERVGCAMNGDFKKYKAKTFCYCWVIWEKGYKSETVLRWI